LPGHLFAVVAFEKLLLLLPLTLTPQQDSEELQQQQQNNNNSKLTNESPYLSTRENLLRSVKRHNK